MRSVRPSRALCGSNAGGIIPGIGQGSYEAETRKPGLAELKALAWSLFASQMELHLRPRAHNDEGPTGLVQPRHEPDQLNLAKHISRRKMHGATDLANLQLDLQPG